MLHSVLCLWIEIGSASNSWDKFIISPAHWFICQPTTCETLGMPIHPRETQSVGDRPAFGIHCSITKYCVERFNQNVHRFLIALRPSVKGLWLKAYYMKWQKCSGESNRMNKHHWWPGWNSDLDSFMQQTFIELVLGMLAKCSDKQDIQFVYQRRLPSRGENVPKSMY